MAGVTMSIHKLTAGSGYDYLTRQVAAFDATEKGHVPLASYYTERGESPGVWIGSGLAGIDGLKTGDPVTAEQMRALFGVGLHPLAAQRQQQLQGPDLTNRDYQAVTRLGAPFKIYRNDIPRFGLRLPSGSPNSMRRQACPETGRYPAANGPGYAPRWLANSSPPNTAGPHRMPGNWPPRSRNIHAPKQPRSPATTSPSPR
jgi:TrwC relaxase